MRTLLLIITLSSFTCVGIRADDGYRLWLKYDLIQSKQKRDEYNSIIKAFVVVGNSATLQLSRQELQLGISGLLGLKTSETSQINPGTILVITARDASRYPELDLT